jgi:hypothetical protein
VSVFSSALKMEKNVFLKKCWYMASHSGGSWLKVLDLFCV